MTTEEEPGKNVVRFARRTPLWESTKGSYRSRRRCGREPRAVVVQFWIIQPFFQPVDFRWSLTGIVSILFLLCLFAVVAVYSSTGGGLVGCCFIPIAPAFIAKRDLPECGADHG